jgi:hypothetical protein
MSSWRMTGSVYLIRIMVRERVAPPCSIRAK